MAAQANIDNYDFTHAVVKLSRSVEELTKSAAVENGSAVVEFPEVNPGNWTITAEVWGKDKSDNEEHPVFIGTADSLVTAGDETVVTLPMVFASGDVLIRAYKPPNAVLGEVVLLASAGPITESIELLPPEGTEEYYTAEFTDLEPWIRTVQILWKDENDTVINPIEIDVDIKPGRTTIVTVGKEYTVGQKDVDIVWEDEPNAPTSLTAVTEGDLIKLSWTAPVGVDVAFYSIYRAETETGLRKRLKALRPITDTTYVDGSFKNGGTYYYWVVAETVDGTTSSFSNMASATVVFNPGMKLAINVKEAGSEVFKLYLVDLNKDAVPTGQDRRSELVAGRR